MKKKAKKIIFIASPLFIVFMFISMIKFSISNPFIVINGLYRITFTGVEYMELQKYPKVIISKPEYSYKLLTKYMEEQGYIENDRLGAIIEFSKSDSLNYVEFSVNKYYSLWKWRE